MLQGDADALMQAAKEERTRVEEEMLELKKQSEILKAKLLQEQVHYEQEKLDLESKKVGVEKRMVDAEKAKEEELSM